MQEVGGSIPPGSTIQFLTNALLRRLSHIVPTFPALAGMKWANCSLGRDFSRATSGPFSAKSQASEKIFQNLGRLFAETGSTLGRDRFDTAQ